MALGFEGLVCRGPVRMDRAKVVGVLILSWFLGAVAYWPGTFVPKKDTAPGQEPSPAVARIASEATPPDRPTLPPWNSVLYSLDVLLPVVDLDLGDSYVPAESNGDLCNRFYWATIQTQIVLGWVLTSLAVVGLTGLVRRIP